jgi:hypothetical protein
MGDRILGQKRRLHANLRAHPFSLFVWLVDRVIAWTSTTKLGTECGTLDLIKMA